MHLKKFITIATLQFQNSNILSNNIKNKIEIFNKIEKNYGNYQWKFFGME